MDKYLCIITTILVTTQVIRVTQNHIQLRRQRKEIDKYVGWIRDKDISERDFETQREVFRLLKDYLESKYDFEEESE